MPNISKCSTVSIEEGSKVTPIDTFENINHELVRSHSTFNNKPLFKFGGGKKVFPKNIPVPSCSPYVSNGIIS